MIECQGATPGTLSVTTTASVIPVWYVGTNTVATGQSYTPSTATPTTTVYVISDSSTVTGCTNLSAGNTLTVSVTVNQSPTLNTSNLSYDTANCGQSGGINGITVVGGTSGFTYQWYYYPTGGPITGANSATLTGQPTGTYSLQVTDANGCIAGEAGGVTTFSVPASSAVVASFSTNLPSPITGSIPLVVSFTNTSTGANTYTWTFGDGNSSNSSTNISNTYTATGTYSVMLVAMNGTCTDTARAIVITEIPTTIIIPNIFSPNGDGINDEFFIVNTGMSTLNCEIFNRWGQLLATLTAPNQSWDGRIPNGDKAPEGTYMYILQAQGLDGKTYKQNGTVTLVR